MSKLLEDLSAFSTDAVCRSIATTILGSKINSGYSRDVYHCYCNDDLVVKVAKNFDGIQANHAEFELWGKVQHWEGTAENLKDWFVPSIIISEDGKVLLSEYAQPVREDEMPEKVLNCLTDLKASNFGLHDGKIKCLDYGLNLIIEKGITQRLVKRL